MGEHTGREPADKLDVVNVDTGDSRPATIELSEGGIETYEHPDKPGSWVIDADGQWHQVDLSLDGEKFSARAGWGGVAMDGLLARMEERRLSLNACYTCVHYDHQSRLVGEWSNGTEAYCLLTGESDMENLVHMLHVCTDWTGPRTQ
jgi:hypothetical protein